MKRNLFISTGYFATLVSAIIVDMKKKSKVKPAKNYLLIIISKEFSLNEDIQEEIKNQIFFAKSVGKWHKIDVVKEEDFPLSTYNNHDYNMELFNDLFGGLQKKQFFELYISSLNILVKLAKIITFKKAHIIDEGIGTYFQIKEAQDLSQFNKFYHLLPSDFVISSIGDKIQNVSLSLSLLYKKLHKLNKIYKTPKINHKIFVVAISSFYFIKEEKSKLINIYEKYLQELIKQNIAIKVKLHPRNNQDDFIKFKDIILNLKIPLLDMYLIKNKKSIDRLFSMSSSILFMCKYIYKIPSTFINYEINDSYNTNINEFYKKYIK